MRTLSIPRSRAYLGATSATLGIIRFYNIDTGALISTQATTMDVNVLVIGY
jgi:hypothetical protein